jgi:Alginate lyase
MTLVSDDEAEPIHSAIIRKEAWTLDAVRRLRAEAERRLREGPWTVTADRPKDLDLDVHDYYSEAPYWWPDPANPTGPYVRRDGVVNGARFMANKIALNSMCDAVFTLGTAAYLLDDPRYARRAALLIRVWFLNPQTRMNPDLEYSQAIRGSNSGRGAGILDGRVFIQAIQGMEFLANTGAWDPREQKAVREWFTEYLRWLAHSKHGLDEKRSGNNHASWWTAQTAAAATFVEDNAAAQAAFNFYRDTIFPSQIRRDGSAPREEARTKSLSYSAFNVEAYAMICRIAQVNGVDLWTVRTRDGATLATVIDYLMPSLKDPNQWRREQIAAYQTDGAYFLAFAGMGLKRPDYVALFRTLERPSGAWSSLVDLIVGRWEASGHQTRH